MSKPLLAAENAGKVLGMSGIGFAPLSMNRVETPRAGKLGSKPRWVNYDADDSRISHHFRASE
ncbi:MAG: hypothetical protein JSS54_12125 [Proteobacteria bacterium]|nr:hypothetical protein [Pseudomonadota bacterium]MBS0269713.1 hypothetical protein [Pseudomonadota bacterium]